MMFAIFDIYTEHIFDNGYNQTTTIPDIYSKLHQGESVVLKQGIG